MEGAGIKKQYVWHATTGTVLWAFFVVVARGPAAGQAHEVGFRGKEGGKLPKTQR